MAPEDSASRAPWIASTGPYSHSPINSQAEIRIMELLPPAAPTPDNLFCTLITAELSDKPSYEALSYAWGAEIFPERLYLPTGYLLITSNLAAALRQLRNVDQPRRLWVDAVCIDQHDDVEKQHQVPLMGRIFGNTKCALAWLGPGSRHTRSAINILRELANSAWRYGIHDKDKMQTIWDRNVSDVITHALRDLSGRLDYVALIAFFEQDWFSRLWIVQEAALPSRLNFYNGQEILEFDIFLKGCHVIDLMLVRGILNETPNMRLIGEELQHQNVLIMFREIMQSSDKSYADRGAKLLYLVSNSEVRGSKRDVDRVYALLGLQVRQDDIILDVNYGRSVEYTYEDFAFKYLQKNEIRILNKAGERRQAGVVWDKKYHKSKLACKLPTWVPDWRYKPILSGIGSSKRYRAATDVSPSFLLGEDILPFVGVTGFLTDIVKAELLTFFPMLKTLPSLKHIWEDWPEGIIKLRDLCSHFHKEEPYPTGEDMDVSFVRTIFLDRRSKYVKVCLPDLSNPQDFRSIWLELKKNFEKMRGLPDDKETETHENYSTASSDVARYRGAGEACGKMRNFFITESGYIGLGPWDLQPEDAIVIFEGASIPFVLRRVQQNDAPKMRGESDLGHRVASEEQWEIVGECYLHGFMENEILESKYADKKQIFWIT